MVAFIYALEDCQDFFLVLRALPEDTKERVWFLSEGVRDAVEIAIVI